MSYIQLCNVDLEHCWIKQAYNQHRSLIWIYRVTTPITILKQEYMIIRRNDAGVNYQQSFLSVTVAQ